MKNLIKNIKFKKNSKIIYSVFVFIFLANVVVLNWNDVSWIFNHRVAPKFFHQVIVSELENKTKEIHLDKNQKQLELVSSESVENSVEIKETTEATETTEGNIFAGNFIEINSINIRAPLVFPENKKEDSVYEALDRGVAHFPDSALPGEKGVLIVLGHSSPPNWPKINYDWVFTDVEKLEKNNVINIYYNSNLYRYVVEDKIFLEVGEATPTYNDNESRLLILSCWPPGKNIKRIGIVARLQG